LAPSERAEEQALDLIGGEDLVFDQAEQDLMVSLVEVARARAMLTCFFSSHVLGTVLPLLRWMVSGGIAP
jgi:hypothetical protein